MPIDAPPTAVPLPFDPTRVGDEVLLSQGGVALRGGLYDQALRCYQLILERCTSPSTRCEALRLSSTAHRLRSAWTDAVEAARLEQAEARAAGLVERVAEALNAEAAVYLARGEFARARPLLQTALETATEPRMLGVLWQNLGTLEAQAHEQDAAAAEAAFERSLRFFEKTGDQWGVACTLINTGCLRLDRGDYQEAASVFSRAVDAGRAANDLDLVASAMMNRARALFHVGRLDEAEFSASSAAGFYVSAKVSMRYAECLLVLGDIERARGADGIAERCWRRALETASALDATGLVTEIRERLDGAAGISAAAS